MNGKSWKTTVGGIAAILAGVALLGNMISGNAEFSTENITMVIGSIGAGIGLFSAKDKNVTGAGGDATTVK